MSDWSTVTEFENKLAEFFGAPFCVATDSCTHGLELCLRYKKNLRIECPKRTYLSIPMLAYKLHMNLIWKDENWKDYYYLTNRIIDAAVLWKANSYLPGSYMCISFQYQKHLNLGRGGCILTDDKTAAIQLKKMSYDGRIPGIPWRDQNVDTFGFHYYMLPEIAELGLQKLPEAIKIEPRQWVITDWPDLTTMDVFKNYL